MRVWSAPTSVARSRLTYRPLWRLHPSLHFVQAFWRPARRAAAWRPASHPGWARLLRAAGLAAGSAAARAVRRVRLWSGSLADGATDGPPSALDDLLRGRRFQRADRVLVPGKFTAGLLADWHVPRKRIVSVPYGAESRPSCPPASGHTLLTVARLIPRKGIDTVIKARSATCAPTTQYRIVGSGPDVNRELQALAAAQGVLERVHFLGRLDAEALADEYRRCTVFVLPARRMSDGDLEGYGLVYFEAAAWGRPVVAGRSGGEVDAVVDGETGLLVDGESSAQVGQAISKDCSPTRRSPAVLARLAGIRVERTHNWSRRRGHRRRHPRVARDDHLAAGGASGRRHRRGARSRS